MALFDETYYFKQLMRDGWTLCGSFRQDQDYLVLASTPEKKALGLELDVGNARGWLVTPPSPEAALRLLIKAALKARPEVNRQRYHGIFLSHTHSDKPFVRRLKAALNERGVEEVWVLTHPLKTRAARVLRFGLSGSPQSRRRTDENIQVY